MTEYRTTTRFLARGLTGLARDGLDRIATATAEAAASFEKLASHESEFQRASADEIVDAYLKVHVAGYNAEHAKLLADLHRATLMDSIEAASGALLALVKQGISRVHSGLASCPSGRAIGRSHLRDVVWQARNQSTHCDEGTYRVPVLNMFAELEADFGSAFHLEQGDTESKALLIVLHLDWLNDDVYDSDVKDLLG